MILLTTSISKVTLAKRQMVKALRQIDDLPEATAISRMKPLNLTLDDGVLLISILKRKAQDNNRRLGNAVWTPRMVDMVLWTYGR